MMPVLLLLALLPLRADTVVIIDTDAGSDDLMAIGYLLQRNVRIEAIAAVHGLAHVPAGVENIRKLLRAAGEQHIPVYPGAERPMRKSAEFPKPWRDTSDRLLAGLPPLQTRPEATSAIDYYARSSFAGKTILALGPLTNLAMAIQRGAKFENIVLMGGAVRVPGNLGDGGFFKTKNKTAEWNIFCDSLAADVVFRSGARIRMIGLDATNKVPLDIGFLDTLQKSASTPVAKAVAMLLEADRPFMEQNLFFAWDPLAAVSLPHPEVVKLQTLQITIRKDGTTVEDARGNLIDVALDADAALFRERYLAVMR